MIDKETFVERVMCYKNFNDYIDKLADLGVNIWEHDSFGWFDDSYVEMLCDSVGLPRDDVTYNEVENLLYEELGCATKEYVGAVYDFVISKNKNKSVDKFPKSAYRFFSVEDEEEDKHFTKEDFMDLLVECFKREA